jgi:hypothetical protein
MIINALPNYVIGNGGLLHQTAGNDGGNALKGQNQ